ncbi:hypothetical protein K488DRAFT_18409, partial [Vararia minispora EC-137]
AILYVCLLTTSVWLVRTWRKSWNLPPGPRPIPFFGNILQLPREMQWLTYYKWARQYGPIVYLRFFNERVFVLNTQAAANDILQKKSATASSRPDNMVLASDLY